MTIHKQAQGPAFALGGEIVRTPKHAMRILVRAQSQGLAYLVPQARNVHAMLTRAAIAKVRGES